MGLSRSDGRPKVGHCSSEKPGFFFFEFAIGFRSEVQKWPKMLVFDVPKDCGGRTEFVFLCSSEPVIVVDAWGDVFST